MMSKQRDKRNKNINWEYNKDGKFDQEKWSKSDKKRWKRWKRHKEREYLNEVCTDYF